MKHLFEIKRGSIALFSAFLVFYFTFLGLSRSVIAAAKDESSPEEMQDRPVPLSEKLGKDSVEDEDDPAIAKLRGKPTKYLTLTIGVEHEETLAKDHPSVTFRGDYKKVLSVNYNKSTKQLRFTPKDIGVATMTLHDSTGKMIGEFRIDVKKSNLDKVAREIRSLVGDIEGIEIKIINNRVVVDGQIILPKDYARIGRVIMQFGDQASSLVSLSPVAMRIIADKITKDIHNPEITVRVINDKFVMEGVAKDKDEAERAVKIANTYVPEKIVDNAVKGGWIVEPKWDIVVNLLTIQQAEAPPPGKTIQLVFHYVELSKEYNKGFKFEWMPEISDGSKVQFGTSSTAPGGVVSAITGTISNLLPKLNWAKSHGHARVLQSSSLIVEESKQGVLDSLTKVPYQVVNQTGQQGTQFQDVGVKATVTPTISGKNSDAVSLNMNFSVSSLIGITQAGPLTSQSQVQTVVVVRSGQSAAVGGLITNSSSTGYNRLPANNTQKGNPLLTLLTSKEFNKNQSQFVVFVTPIIKSSASSGSEKIKKKFRIRE